MEINLPDHWSDFIKIFTKKHKEDIVYDVVRVFRTKEEIRERYDTHEFEEFLPEYIPVADDSAGQVAVISKNNKDTKVYLSSYGVLQKELLEVLDRDLMHWMQRKFPFDKVQHVLSDADIEKREKENSLLVQKVSLFPVITEFLKDPVCIEGLALPENYASVEHIYYFQDGYQYNSVENKVLARDVPGEFKPSWIVLASNYFADPFFIDLNEAKDGFPVYFAWHGQGNWKPVKVAENLTEFQNVLLQIQSVRFDKAGLIDYFDENIDLENPLWEEVYASIEEEEECVSNSIEAYEAMGSEVNLYITDIGPNKMKVIALLKREFGLSGSEALELSKKSKILFRTGYTQWLEYDRKQLEDLGAKVGFEALS
ncbi:SMI1/KNR4 family protein [Chryseobacterium sp. StRB126]|uniref:SMI1/KNR4 family protein n=1 Tax=Chryseobacterium sp. StRB126 TaxID=878220 RepID=UPI000B206702|nr:SMI1/KNR4 family protein [Chryseobacterium sp. StRB126]